MKTLCTLLSLLLACSVTHVLAQTPRTLSYQGVLTDAAGNPKPDGPYQLTVRLYTTESGGPVQWSEIKTISAAKGLFTTLLGEVTPFPPSLTWAAPYWISMQVDAGKELAPRIKLATTAYSFRAIIADNAVTVNDGAITAAKLAPNSVTAPAIADGSVQMTDLAQGGASSGQALLWNGSQWAPGTVGSGGSFSAGQGINIAGAVISNTGDLSDVNELQALSLAGDQLSLSKGGGTVTLPVGGGGAYSAGTGIAIAGKVISNIGDLDDKNEIQTLSLAGDQLSLSKGGGTVTLPGGGASSWDVNGNDISNSNSRNVGIGTANPAWKLDLKADGEAFRIDGVHPWMELWDGGTRGGYFRNLDGNIELGTVGSNTNGSLALWAGGKEAMRIAKDGKIGLGTAPSLFDVEVKGNLHASGWLQADGSVAVSGLVTASILTAPDARLEKLRFPGPGPEWTILGTGTYNLDFWNGTNLKAYVNVFNGNWTPMSDRRMKKDILPYPPVLDGVKRLNVCTYLFLDQSDATPRSLGLIAQEVREVFPELVSSTTGKNGEEMFGVAYAQTGVIALKAIQEQQALIEKLTRRVEELEKRLSGK
jgi:hypothetical protein